MMVTDRLNKGEKEAVQPRPEWLDDEPEVIGLLNQFLDMLDKKPVSERVRMPIIHLNEKSVPNLLKHDEVADRTWELCQDLEGLIYEIRPNPKRSPYEPEYVGASLRLLEGGENISRLWLSRPQRKRYQYEWAAAVDVFARIFSDHGQSLLARPIKVPGRSANEIVGAFAKIADIASQHLTLRQISARIFWGQSKVLDSREDLLNQLFPSLNIAPRPVIVHVHLPDEYDGVLFIENQDTYIQSLEGKPEGVNRLAIVYSAGFRGSAERVRTRDGVSLHYHNECGQRNNHQFESWWFKEKSLTQLVWFWGDLDFSGMAILKVLRSRFGEIQAWKPGYEPMLQLLREGKGHFPEEADKTEQVDPKTTGCSYADQELLPEMRQLKHFLDQEII